MNMRKTGGARGIRAITLSVLFLVILVTSIPARENGVSPASSGPSSSGASVQYLPALLPGNSWHIAALTENAGEGSSVSSEGHNSGEVQHNSNPSGGHAAGTGHGSAGSHHEEGGLLNIDRYIFWQMANFLILFAFLWKFLFTPIGKTLEQRRLSIQQSFNEIAEKKAEAERIKCEYEEKLARIEAEAQNIRREAVMSANAQKEEILNEARNEARQIIERAGMQIKIEKEKMLAEVQQHIVSIAIRAAEKVIRAELDEAKHRKLIEDFILEAGNLEWQRK